MNRKGDKSLIVGLDIGTSKVVALVGEYSPGNPIEVIGIGSHESRGLKRGVVVDIESTVQSIQRAVEEAELMAGCEIRSVYASISGNHVQCKNSPGIVPIRDGEVTWNDLDRVLEAAKAVVVEKFVDPRTVSVHGSVSVSVYVPPHARNRSEEYALDALKAEALREHPGTTLLFGVTLKAGSDANGIVASGVAARSRGD